MSASRTTPKELRALILRLDAELNDIGGTEQDRKEVLKDLEATARDITDESDEPREPSSPSAPGPPTNHGSHLNEIPPDITSQMRRALVASIDAATQSWQDRFTSEFNTRQMYQNRCNELSVKLYETERRLTEAEAQLRELRQRIAPF